MVVRRRTRAGAAPARAEGSSRSANAVLTAPESDGEAVAAVLSVFHHVELSAQLEKMLSPIVTWSEADGAIAIAADEESGGMIPVASTLDEAHPILSALRELSPPAGRLELARIKPGPTLEQVAEVVHRHSGTVMIHLDSGDGVAVAALVIVGAQRQPAPHVDALCALARPAIANALQVRTIRELTIRDDTAECFNRRYFEESLVEELARANRFKTPMSLIFFDMDNLKQINNQFGHAVGSRTLLEISRRVRVKIRKFDKLFRFGGDEFCIVLPETEWHGAVEVAERSRDAISSKPVPLGPQGKDGGPRMTASFGIASFPLHARTKEDLVVKADRAMQSVKNTTKNGIAVAELDGRGNR